MTSLELVQTIAECGRRWLELRQGQQDGGDPAGDPGAAPPDGQREPAGLEVDDGN
ncbi:MAG: hypothetical protein JW850_20310 [Thermoflexales bacterium]|nr:hypothetical protein [Thermoflexales bacterium]